MIRARMMADASGIRAVVLCLLFATPLIGCKAIGGVLSKTVDVSKEISRSAASRLPEALGQLSETDGESLREIGRDHLDQILEAAIQSSSSQRRGDDRE